MSTIGHTFPVKGHHEHKSVPWGLVEPHRAAIQKEHGRTLEYLAANGGLEAEDLVDHIGEAALPPPPKEPKR